MDGDHQIVFVNLDGPSNKYDMSILNIYTLLKIMFKINKENHISKQIYICQLNVKYISGECARYIYHIYQLISTAKMKYIKNN